MINVMVCGTPGTGKSSLIEKVKHELSSEYGFNFINVSELAKKHGCITGYDEELGCDVLDEEKLEHLLKSELDKDEKRNVIESIHADLLPAESINAVFVCRTDNTKLYDRLKQRNYPEKKISNNLEAEIFQTILDEVRDCFSEEKIHQLVNDESSDLEKNAFTFMSILKRMLES